MTTYKDEAHAIIAAGFVVDAPSVTIRTAMWPQWLRIALDSLSEAQQARDRNLAAIGRGMVGDYIQHERERHASMIAVVASAAAIESFCNNLDESGLVTSPAPTLCCRTCRRSMDRARGTRERVLAVLEENVAGWGRWSREVSSALRFLIPRRNTVIHHVPRSQPSLRHPVLGTGTTESTYHLEDATGAVLACRSVVMAFAGNARGGSAERGVQSRLARDIANGIFGSFELVLDRARADATVEPDP